MTIAAGEATESGASWPVDAPARRARPTATGSTGGSTAAGPYAAGPYAAGPAAVIAGIGVALPGRPRDQRAIWDGYFRGHFAGSRAAERIFAGAGVRQRHAVADPLTEDVSRWSTQQRMRRYTLEAHPLGHRAVTTALARAGLTAADVSLLVVASCTGYGTPGLDIQLAASLRLPPDTQRLLVGHMGCYAAIPALRSAADFVVTRRRPAVLLCLELTSLHVQPPTDDPQQVVSHALFGDAAVAIVLTPESTVDGDPAAGVGRPALRLLDVASVTDTTAIDAMAWEVTDHGFRMVLLPAVPAVLARHVGPAVRRLLDTHGLRVSDVHGWAVHPGGPAILDTVERELDLPPAALAASRSVLARHGNCSSPTVLLVLDELVRGGVLDRGGPVVAMAFGPGLTLYVALLLQS